MDEILKWIRKYGGWVLAVPFLLVALLFFVMKVILGLI